MKDSQFLSFRRYMNNRKRGKIIFVKEGVIVSRIKKFGTKESETAFLDLTNRSKK